MSFATTMSFAGIVACQVGNVFACRSNRPSILRTGFGGYRLLAAGIVVEIGLMILLIYAAPLADVFGFAPLGFRHWLPLLAFAPAPTP